MLFTANLSKILAKDHPARVVSRLIDQINLAPLIDAYSRQGASAYQPRMLLKLIVFAYLSNNSSSRKIVQQCRESAPFMGLSAMTKPDHNTINPFRCDRLKHVLGHVFTKISLLLAENGLVSLNENLFVDGTKIEANAKRYTLQSPQQGLRQSPPKHSLGEYQPLKQLLSIKR